MDKTKFIKKAKEYGYSDEEIDEIIQDYEKYLKKGIDVDPIDFLVEMPVITSFSAHSKC